MDNPPNQNEALKPALPLNSPPAAPIAANTAPSPSAPTVATLAPNPLSHLNLSFQPADYAAKGYHLETRILPDQVVSSAMLLDREGFALDTITGVDWLVEGQIEVVYDYFRFDKSLRVVVRTRIPREQPEVPSICQVFPGANWHEREAHDFFGIGFLGHPNLTPFLLPEDATYHPLRKDFTA